MAMELELVLPPVGDEPTRYPDFCLSLSNRLIQALDDVFSEAARRSSSGSNLILSVGSGSGLLEAHLQNHWSTLPGCNLLVHGVEVQTADGAEPVNRYLPEQNCSTVRGTSQLSPDIQTACALLFVYPREPGLVSRYLQAANDIAGSPLQTVVWLGPRADNDIFAACLQFASGSDLGNNVNFGPVEIMETCGLVGYEMMAVIRRSAATQPASAP